MSTDNRPTLRESITVSLDSHGMKALLGLPDDEFDCCVAEVVGVIWEWLGEQREAVENEFDGYVDEGWMAHQASHAAISAIRTEATR